MSGFDPHLQQVAQPRQDSEGQLRFVGLEQGEVVEQGEVWRVTGWPEA